MAWGSLSHCHTRPGGTARHPDPGRTLGGDTRCGRGCGSATPSGHPPCVLHDAAQPRVRTAAVPCEERRGLGVLAVPPSARWHRGVSPSSPWPRGGGYLRPCGACSTSCPRSAPVSVPVSPPWPPRCRTVRERCGVTAGTPGPVLALSPALSPALPRLTHLVDAAGAGRGADAPDKGIAATAALERPTPARKRMVGTGTWSPAPGDTWPQRSREEVHGVTVLCQPIAPVLHKLVQGLQGVLSHPDPVLGRPCLHGHQHDAGVELLLVDLWGQRDGAGDVTPPREKHTSYWGQSPVDNFRRWAHTSVTWDNSPGTKLWWEKPIRWQRKKTRMGQIPWVQTHKGPTPQDKPPGAKDKLPGNKSSCWEQSPQG